MLGEKIRIFLERSEQTVQIDEGHYCEQGQGRARFEGHPRLVGLYLPEDFDGHPGLKSFKLPTRTLVKAWPGAKDPAAASSGRT